MHAVSRNDIRAEAANIRRFATVAAIKRRALDPAPIADEPRDPLRDRPRPKRPRAVLAFPPRYARLLQACMCLRAR
jgi:hypothetical protein